MQQILLALALVWSAGASRARDAPRAISITARFGLPRLADFMLKQAFGCDAEMVAEIESSYQAALIQKLTGKANSPPFSFPNSVPPETIKGAPSWEAFCRFLRAFFDLNFALQNLAIPDHADRRAAYPFRLVIVAESDRAGDTDTDIDTGTDTTGGMQRAMRAFQPITALLHHLSSLNVELVVRLDRRIGERLMAVYGALWRTLAAAVELLAGDRWVCKSDVDYVTLLKALSATHAVLYVSVNYLRHLMNCECASLSVHGKTCINSVSNRIVSRRVTFHTLHVTSGMLPVEVIDRIINGTADITDARDYICEANRLSLWLTGADTIDDALRLRDRITGSRFAPFHEARLLGFTDHAWYAFARPFLMNLWFGSSLLPPSFAVTDALDESGGFVVPKFLLDALHVIVFSRSKDREEVVKCRILLCDLENDLIFARSCGVVEGLKWNAVKAKINRNLYAFQLRGIHGQLFTQSITTFTHSYIEDNIARLHDKRLHFTVPTKDESLMCRLPPVDYFEHHIKELLATRHLTGHAPVKRIITEYRTFNLWTAQSGLRGESLHIRSMLACLWIHTF